MLRGIFVCLIVAAIGSVSFISCQDLHITYNATMTSYSLSNCMHREDSIKQDIKVLLKNSVLPNLNHTENSGPEYGGCHCSYGGPGWSRSSTPSRAAIATPSASWSIIFCMILRHIKIGSSTIELPILICLTQHRFTHQIGAHWME